MRKKKISLPCHLAAPYVASLHHYTCCLLLHKGMILVVVSDQTSYSCFFSILDSDILTNIAPISFSSIASSHPYSMVFSLFSVSLLFPNAIVKFCINCRSVSLTDHMSVSAVCWTEEDGCSYRPSRSFPLMTLMRHRAAAAAPTAATAAKHYPQPRYAVQC